MDEQNRIIRLEEQTYFQDEKLKDLDKRLLAQQIQLDGLAKQLEAVTNSLREVRDYLRDRQRGSEEKPPHYGADTW